MCSVCIRGDTDIQHQNTAATPSPSPGPPSDWALLLCCPLGRGVGRNEECWTIFKGRGQKMPLQKYSVFLELKSL